MGNPKIIEKKKQIIDEIAQKLEKANAVYFADFKGMTVRQVNEMRRTFDKDNIEYKVYKNSYISFAMKDSPMFDKISSILAKNTALALTYDDPVSPARVLKDIQKKYDKPSIKAAIVEGKYFDSKGVKAIADLPSKEVLLSQLVAGVQSPITGLVYSLSGILGSFVYTVEAIKNKKEA